MSEDGNNLFSNQSTIQSIDSLVPKRKHNHRKYSIKTHGINFHATKKKRHKSKHKSKRHASPIAQEHEESPFLSFNLEPETKYLYNEKNARELVNTVRQEMSELIDEDLKPTLSFSPNNQNTNRLSEKKTKKKKKSRKAKTPKPKKHKRKTTKPKKHKTKATKLKKHKTKTAKPKKHKTKTMKKLRLVPKKKRKKKKKMKSTPKKHIHSIEKNEHPTTLESGTRVHSLPSANCCCNFLHYSLRQVMRDAEQMKQFALNTSMIGLDPSKLRDPTNTLCPAVCIPMYNCENIGDQRFPSGPTFTTLTKSDLTPSDPPARSMVIQTIDTQRGPIQIKLDPQSFGLAPFFSDQYETFIKGPSNSIFFTSYLNTYHDNFTSN